MPARHPLDAALTDHIADLVFSYYEWLAGTGNRTPDKLLAECRDEASRRLFLERCDDVLTIWGITAPIRQISTLEDLPQLRRVPKRAEHS